MIDTEKYSQILRRKTIKIEERKILIANLQGSIQEQDITEPVNCNGFGRVRHFRRQTSKNWPENTLPIDPAASKLNLGKRSNIAIAQVFQSASCNWRCWYCFVPFDLLKGSTKHASFHTPNDLIDSYVKADDPPKIIDLTGGQPELTPEWVLWFMQDLKQRDLEKKTYLWSDDNLSNDYFWKYLSDNEIQQIVDYTNYGKVCCFKGFDQESFAFNTDASKALYQNQFNLFRRYLSTGIDLYAYATFTGPSLKNLKDKVKVFADNLQSISPNLPLRLVPLEIQFYKTVIERGVTQAHKDALRVQAEFIEHWMTELSLRFNSTQRSLPIDEVTL